MTKKRFIAIVSLVVALSVILTARFLINISSIIGIIPAYGFSLPFVSYSNSIIVFPETFQ